MPHIGVDFADVHLVRFASLPPHPVVGGGNSFLTHHYLQMPRPPRPCRSARRRLRRADRARRARAQRHRQRLRAPVADDEKRLLPDVHPRGAPRPALAGAAERDGGRGRERDGDEDEDHLDPTGVRAGHPAGYPCAECDGDEEGCEA